MCETAGHRLIRFAELTGRGEQVVHMRRGMGRAAKWAVPVGVLVVVVAVLWAGLNGSGRQSVVDAEPLGNAPVGTSGQNEDAPEPYGTAATLHDLETMTGVVDEHELIGRRVDFHVKVVDIGNAGAFWIGTGDNRELVVLGRDNRSDAQRDLGAPSPDNIKLVAGGQMVHVTGTIEPVPYAEARDSWGLSAPQHHAIDNPKVYIRADSVTPEG